MPKDPNIIKDRDKRTVNRMMKKEFYDSLISLGTNGGPNTKVRLLDEGMLTYADGSPWFYIKKGTIDKFINGENEYLENITSDYVGSINLGHMDFATFPFLLGFWDKSNLSVSDNGEGRKGLDIEFKLDEESAFVKELRRMPYTLAVSAEFNVHRDYDAMEELGIEVVDEILVTDFAIVGDGGNVGSNNIELKGGDASMDKKEKKLEVVESIDEKVEETVEEVELEAVEEIEAEVEETVVEEVAEDVEAEAVEVEAEEVAEEPDAQSEILLALSGLKDQLSQIQAENKELKEKLAAKEKADKEFAEKFKSLNLELSEKKEEPKKKECVANRRYVGNDGIGE